MLHEGSSDLIQHWEASELKGRYAEKLRLNDNKVVVLTETAAALYKDEASIDDPLGNGLISMCEFPESFQLSQNDTPWVETHRSGFVGLCHEKVMLILPNGINFYPSKSDGLRNTNLVCELSYQ